MSDIDLELPKRAWEPFYQVFKNHGVEPDGMLRGLKRDGEWTDNSTQSIHVQDDWKPSLLLDLYEKAKELKLRHVATTCRAMWAIRKDASRALVKKLELLPEAIRKYMAIEAIDGWLYKLEDDRYTAYAVEECKYIPEDYRGRSPAYVTIDLIQNRPRNLGENSRTYETGVSFHRSDIRGTVAEILLAKGLAVETEELKAEYVRCHKLFIKHAPGVHKQFRAAGVVLPVSDDDWWTRHNKYSLPARSKVVNDESLLKRHIATKHSAWWWRQAGVKANFDNLPTHPWVLCYDLNRHQNCFVHAADMEPYVYRPELRTKLVLPPAHRDMIDLLTTDLGVFAEDIIEGKSGGTTILSMSEIPGVGKTLTAEVYAEVIGKPLYRVHAGQLGTTTETVENKLEDIMRRAERWGAILLIDEADVYIRRRDNNLDHNAVVASFLRTMEYFTGLMFMTTNLGKDVDEAIKSRCIALLDYKLPTPKQATRIWETLSKEFKMDLPPSTIGDLLTALPSLSGRDIKQLLRLTGRYCKYKKLPLTVDNFRKCAMFRGH